MRRSRTGRAAVAVVITAGAIALSAPGSASASTLPTCEADVEATWTTRYADGRYELDTLTLEGLADCTGDVLDVAITADDDTLAVAHRTVAGEVMVLDLAAERIAAAHLDRLAIAVTVTDAGPTPAVGGAVTARAPETSAVDGGTSDGVTHPPLAGTGVQPAWLLVLAGALTFVGALVRRRRRHLESPDA